MKPLTNNWRMSSVALSKACGLWLAGLCCIWTLVLGWAANASASSLLFLPKSGIFPYALEAVGNPPRSQLLDLGGSQFLFKNIRATALVLSRTAFDLHVTFEEADLLTAGGGKPCASTKELADFLGHFGLADAGGLPATLLLTPKAIEFLCDELNVSIKGELVGSIPNPTVGKASELLFFLFQQTKGVQEFTSFLLENKLLTNQFAEMELGTKGFLQAGLSSTAFLLQAQAGEGKFTLDLAP